MTRPTPILEMSKSRFITTGTVTTDLVLTGRCPNDQIVILALCELFKSPEVFVIQSTSYTTNLTVIHSNRLPTQRLCQRLSDILSPLHSGCQVTVEHSTSTTAAVLGALTMRQVVR